jgi:hypothetical protein
MNDYEQFLINKEEFTSICNNLGIELVTNRTKVELVELPEKYKMIMGYNIDEEHYYYRVYTTILLYNKYYYTIKEMWEIITIKSIISNRTIEDLILHLFKAEEFSEVLLEDEKDFPEQYETWVDNKRDLHSILTEEDYNKLYSLFKSSLNNYM